MLSILIPVKQPEPWLKKCLKQLEMIKERNGWLIGEILTCETGTMAEARLKLAKEAKYPFICNLDADVILPFGYLQDAFDLLKKDARVGAVAINHRPKSMYHLGFGTSVMRRSVMLTHYDFIDTTRNPPCECMHMWHKLHSAGFIIATLPYVATHRALGVKH